jgi:hypothetical protein
MLLRNDEGEALGNADGADDLEGRTGVGNISDDAVDSAAAELDGAGFQDPMSRSIAVFVLVHAEPWAVDTGPTCNITLEPQPEIRLHLAAGRIDFGSRARGCDRGNLADERGAKIAVLADGRNQHMRAVESGELGDHALELVR